MFNASFGFVNDSIFSSPEHNNSHWKCFSSKLLNERYLITVCFELLHVLMFVASNTFTGKWSLIAELDHSHDLTQVL